MSIYQDEQNMTSMPDSQVEAYKEGKGAKADEPLLALLEQQKRLGLEADKQAQQNKPMPTVAQQVQQKAGLLDLQDMAKKLGIQITGVAPIGAMPPQGTPQTGVPMGPMMTPQGQPAPAGIAAAAPMGPAVPQAVPQSRPMAHGGIADATPKHMFKFAHGGGVMGFDEGGSAKATEAVNAAMPADMPANSNMSLSDYLAQRQAALKAVAENNPAPAAPAYSGPRQETYAERDVRMHNQPDIYNAANDRFSLANISKLLGLTQATPDEVNRAHASAWGNQNLRYPVPSVMTAQGPALQKTADKTEPTPYDDTSAQVKIVPVPTAPIPTAVGDKLFNPPKTKPTVSPNAGLPAALPKPTPTGDPMKIAQGLAASLPGTSAATQNTTPVEKPSVAEDVVNKYMKTPSEESLIEAEKARAKAFGYDTPAGEDAMKRANLMEQQMAEWNKGHNMDKLHAFLTGIQTGGYGGGAPAAQANEQAYRENVIKNWELINSIKSPIEQARRAEAIGMGKNVAENKAKADELASRTATSLFGEEMRGKSSKELKQMEVANAMNMALLNSATQIKIHQMAQAAADAHRELTPQELEVALRSDPKYKDMSYADRLNAAYGIKTGRSEKMGLSELTQLSKSLAPLATTDADAAEQLKWVTDTLKKRYQTENAPPPPKVGDIVRGFKFKGGEPSNQANWEKV